MNECLIKYKKNKNIWHISGWSPEGIELEQDIYLSRMMFCWGWATWRDKWKFYNKDPERLIKKWSYKSISEFNYKTASNNWNQVLYNFIEKKILGLYSGMQQFSRIRVFALILERVL